MVSCFLDALDFVGVYGIAAADSRLVVDGL